jgi:hypothetical protein
MGADVKLIGRRHKCLTIQGAREDVYSREEADRSTVAIGHGNAGHHRIRRSDEL